MKESFSVIIKGTIFQAVLAANRYSMALHRIKPHDGYVYAHTNTSFTKIAHWFAETPVLGKSFPEGTLLHFSSIPLEDERRCHDCVTKDSVRHTGVAKTDLQNLNP